MAKVQQKTKNPAQTPAKRIKQVVGIVLPKEIKTISAMNNRGNATRRNLFNRMVLGALVDNELNKRSHKREKQTQDDSDI